jgi:hypothetical protein
MPRTYGTKIGHVRVCGGSGRVTTPGVGRPNFCFATPDFTCIFQLKKRNQDNAILFVRFVVKFLWVYWVV